MKLKADFGDRLRLQGLFSGSKYQPSFKMLSAKSSYTSINELCRNIAHQLQVPEKNFTENVNIFFKFCVFITSSLFTQFTPYNAL